MARPSRPSRPSPPNVMIHAVLLLGLAPSPQSVPADLPKTPEARRAAVERLLTPSPWIEGAEFGLVERLRHFNVPGASVAVIHDGAIDWAAGYGKRSITNQSPVTTATAFQAASISKPVSAFAVLLAAQSGELSLDAPINSLLTSWELPSGGQDGDVTPRHLLSHTGGLGVHGFPGYNVFEPGPTALQVLDGAGPANTDPVRRIEPLSSPPRYSGGGSTIMQVALQDVTGEDFTSLMSQRVLEPLGMQHSTFAQPLPVAAHPDYSDAHDWGGRRVLGGFHVYPEQFPAGLWTTPSDLARFAISVQRSLEGETGALLTTESARTFVTPVRGPNAPGLFIEEYAGESWFGHGGANEGFKCMFRASVEGGRGVVVMTNGDQGIALAEEIVRAIARVYGWPGVVEPPLDASDPAHGLESYTGRYAFGPDSLLFVREEDGRLILHDPLDRPYALAALGGDEFLVLGTEIRVRFSAFEAPGASKLRVSTTTDEVAKRLDDFERWPVEDLVDGDLEAGYAFYRDVHAGSPDDPMVARDRLHDLAVGLSNYGHPEAGGGLARLVAELYPGDAGLWDTLGQLELARGNVAAAREAYLAVLEFADDDPRLDASDRAWLRDNATSRLAGLRD